ALMVYACLICDGDRPVVAIAACYVGSADGAEATVAPLRKWGTIVADQLQPMSYVQLQSLFDAARPAGRRCAMRSNFMAALPDAHDRGALSRRDCPRRPRCNRLWIAQQSVSPRNLGLLGSGRERCGQSRVGRAPFRRHASV